LSFFTHTSRLVRPLLLSLALLASAISCGGSTTAPSAALTQTDLVVGSGTQASTGSYVTVAYTGWLYDSTKTDGKGTRFDSSTSFSFTVGVGQVITGWDQGVVGMRVGGQRRLLIPPSLAYGSTGNGVIPANATLVFDISLLNVR
jgi:FKBP-type peptidyl-prolyl cis-trans isomerase FkpA